MVCHVLGQTVRTEKSLSLMVLAHNAQCSMLPMLKRSNVDFQIAQMAGKSAKKESVPNAHHSPEV
jgi:hypothetical protein